jgi:hypothetical protein
MNPYEPTVESAEPIPSFARVASLFLVSFSLPVLWLFMNACALLMLIEYPGKAIAFLVWLPCGVATLFCILIAAIIAGEKAETAAYKRNELRSGSYHTIYFD